ncbi:hypothetical protein HanRHA438_Chr14g0653791 [Helianthus annuus]|nr:hypothetical protein HanRHA438_Chr14g0653791 [Helianthus annuus]
MCQILILHESMFLTSVIVGTPATRMKKVASNVVKKQVFELFTPFNVMEVRIEVGKNQCIQVCLTKRATFDSRVGSLRMTVRRRKWTLFEA